ncbi:NADH-ubiquinone oxidoreductase [Smittium culicis]|uniref:NADH-ubiquinone oxidoreductase n=1 Tax=Smittium culicis TaxID=133412 RepID=A0A1R1XF69_9FUNG|nr:NADH-ubiquinone oxidoreductase [Smittium culicis]
MSSETGKKVPYPIIDTDPRFTRVVKYCRGIDFLGGVAVAAAGPGLMYWFEKFQPSGNSGAPLRAAMKAAGGIGLIAGFLHMYTQSSSKSLHTPSLP